MKLNEIKRNGFYTNGSEVFYKIKDKIVQFYIEKWKNYKGIARAYASDLNQEVFKVNDNTSFYNNMLKVVNDKIIIIGLITYSYFTLQFDNEDNANEYAEKNNFTIFNIQKYNEYISVEFMKGKIDSFKLVYNPKELIPQKI